MADNKIFYIEDDLKKIQTKTNLYLQSYGDKGVFHLFKEGAQNAIDEYTDPDCIDFLKSLGEAGKLPIIVTYDKKTDTVTIEDNGRGIPEEDYPIDIVCTKLQSGAKFFRNQGGASSGEFGVGLTVVNALSSDFRLATYRNSYFHEIRFKDGIKVEDIREKLGKKGKKHGTVETFTVNPMYLGAGSHLPFDMCIDWMEDMSYQVQEGLIFDVKEYDGLELIREKKIKKKPFADLIYRFIEDKESLIIQPLSFKGTGSIEEEIKESYLAEDGSVIQENKMMEKHMTLEFAFAYSSDLESNYQSYCNFTKTEEHGVHVEAVEDALCRFLQAATVNSMTDNQKSKWDITRADVKAGLLLVVNLSTNAQVQFMGNAKNKIQNQELKPILKEIVKTKVEEFFEANPGKLNAITKAIINSARARIEIQKQRVTGITKTRDVFKEMEYANFIAANNPGDHGELFLVEGQKSAFGSLVDARDPSFQAIFGFRGMAANPFKCSYAKIMENAEWKAYVNILHTGIGPSFDIRRLPYKRINISTDADIDGAGIGVAIAAFHVKHLPQIVEAGRLYKVYPPLYYIDDKSSPFVRSKSELTELHLKKIEKNYKIRCMDFVGNEYLDSSDFWVFLYDTIDYRDTLISAYEYCKVDIRFIEIVTAGLVEFGALYQDSALGEWNIIESKLTDSKFVGNFMKLIQSKFPEVKLEGTKIGGIVNGKRADIRLNRMFVRKIESLIPIYENYGYHLGVKEKNCEERELSIGEFLDETCKLIPAILARYKGLGETDADDLWNTTMNPATRITARLTFDSIARDIEIFMKLKSDKPNYQKQRKQMVESYRINRSDLDT